MRTSVIAKKYGLDREEFEKFLLSNYHQQILDPYLNMSIMEGVDIDPIIQHFQSGQKIFLKSTEDRVREQIAIKAVDNAKNAALANMLITSGFTFDGYSITKYSGYISGDDAISVERGLAIFGFGANVKDKLMESLVVIRRNALAELKEAAYALGCNAVIGVDFDYLTLDPQTHDLIMNHTTYQPYIFGVTANGNAVVIEKNNGANRADQNQKLPDSIDNLPPL